MKESKGTVQIVADQRMDLGTCMSVTKGRRYKTPYVVAEGMRTPAKVFARKTIPGGIDSRADMANDRSLEVTVDRRVPLCYQDASDFRLSDANALGGGETTSAHSSLRAAIPRSGRSVFNCPVRVLQTPEMVKLSSYLQITTDCSTVLLRSIRSSRVTSGLAKRNFVRCHASQSHFGGRFAPLGLKLGFI